MGMTYRSVGGELRDYKDPDRGDIRSTGREKSWVAAVVRDNHHEICRLATLGWKNTEIAKKLGLCVSQVSGVLNSPIVREKVDSLQVARDASVMDIRAELAELGPLAVGRLREALEEGKVDGKELTGVAILREANNLLDREIGRATQMVETKNMNMHFTADDIEEIKERARAMARESDQIIDTEE